MSSLVPYSTPGFRAPIDLDLSRNEGLAPAAELLASVDDPDRVVSRYPNTAALRDSLARLHGLDPEWVLVTAGGDDALHRCFLARVGPDAAALTTRPTFEMVPRYAAQRRARLIEVDWWDGPFPVGSMLEEIGPDVGAAFVVSPNNPTGSVATEADLRKLAAECPLLVVDAAYVEFAEHDPTPALLEIGNVVVVRTLSKAYGLAGLRVGYLLGTPELVAEIGAFGSPYPISSLSAALAVSRLAGPGTAELVAEVIRERVELTTALADLGTAPLASQANFVLTRLDRPDWLIDAAASLGVGFRRFPGRRGLERAVRITLPGREPAFGRLLTTLRSALRPEALIFDLDGVLADVSRSQSLAIVGAASRLGAEVTLAEIEEAKAKGGTNDDWALTRDLCGEKGVVVSLAAATEEFERLYQGDGIDPGLKEQESALVDPATWTAWSERLPLAVVTGRPRSDAVEFLDRFGLSDAISALVTREDAPLKPDPAPVRLTLQRLGVGTAWLLGDTPDDIAAARAADVVPIGVIAPGDDPEAARRRLAAAAIVLKRTTDLEEVLP